MKVTEGVEWIMVCTDEFDRTVSFYRDVLGLNIAEQGTPVVDTQFSRYAMVKMPNKVTVEIVEATHLKGPIVSLTVDDVASTCTELRAQQFEFLTPILSHGEGVGWTYVRSPDGTVYQIQGPYAGPSTASS